MSKVIVTLRVMPESPEVNLKKLEAVVCKRIHDWTGQQVDKVEVVPVAFGLKSLKIIFKVSEDKGGTEPLEKELVTVAGVNSVEVIGLDRTF
jgi:translation elongation factor aEF-1 beta